MRGSTGFDGVLGIQIVPPGKSHLRIFRNRIYFGEVKSFFRSRGHPHRMIIVPHMKWMKKKLGEEYKGLHSMRDCYFLGTHMFFRGHLFAHWIYLLHSGV